MSAVERAEGIQFGSEFWREFLKRAKLAESGALLGRQDTEALLGCHIRKDYTVKTLLLIEAVTPSPGQSASPATPRVLHCQRMNVFSAQHGAFSDDGLRPLLLCFL